MTFTTNFCFRGQSYQAVIYLDYKEQPLYIFATLEDHKLIHLFGEDIYIKTNGEEMLPMMYSYPSHNELRLAIFNSVKDRPEFAAAIRQLYPQKAAA